MMRACDPLPGLEVATSVYTPLRETCGCSGSQPNSTFSYELKSINSSPVPIGSKGSPGDVIVQSCGQRAVFECPRPYECPSSCASSSTVGARVSIVSWPTV